MVTAMHCIDESINAGAVHTSLWLAFFEMVLIRHYLKGYICRARGFGRLRIAWDWKHIFKLVTHSIEQRQNRLLVMPYGKQMIQTGNLR